MNGELCEQDMVPESVVMQMLEEMEELERENSNWEARYNALLQTNVYLRHKSNSVTYSGFTKEELRLIASHMHPDKHDGKEIYNSIMQKLNSIKDGQSR